MSKPYDVPFDQLDAEGQIRELIHTGSFPTPRSAQLVGEWMLQHGFPPADARAAVNALASGVPRQQLSDVVWNRYQQMQAGSDV